ncbi:MAG: 23S rRNA (adenine(2503)-C(2))-methyltransferase RlmN [Clostridia bacterium]|nr:23S rRNA (adenine(2503)-C(2))-methyltransferase RlmN [Clostridia bacterium]
MINILDLSIEELKEKLEQLNIKPFRAKQIYDACFQYKDYDEVSNISKAEKEILKQNFNLLPVSIYKVQESKDGTIKFALKCNDNSIIESVLMSYKYGYTICVSTQVGCRMGCSFCASTRNGLIRNLLASEIIGQILCVNKYLSNSTNERKITNVVLMGCGEPLDNYENLTCFLNLVTNKDYIAISERNISISTCGIVPNIKKLADDGYKINLTISLHAPNDEIRKQLMKVANAYSIKEILDACDYYFEKTHRRVYFEYTMCKGVNDSEDNAKELAKLLKGRVAHVNIIALNAVKEANLETVNKKDAYKFCEILTSAGLSASVRRTLGADIDGACGQLRNKILDETGNK